MRTRKSTLVAAALAMGFVSAVGPAMARDAAPASASASVVRGVVDGHPYETAGLHRQDVSALGRDQKNYDLRMSFTEGWRHARLNNVKVDVYDGAHKEIFSLADARARTNVQLPPGHYRIVANASGIQRSKQVDVKPGASAHVSMHWPGSVARS